MIIGVCGFSSTGSSAVSDYLKEFEETSVFDGKEFPLSFYPDGIEDLAYNLNIKCAKYLSSNISIARFRTLTNRMFSKKNYSKEKRRALIKARDLFLDEIIQVRWRGYGAVDGVLNNSIFRSYAVKFMKHFFIPIYEKTTNKMWNGFPAREMEFSVKPENFDVSAQVFTKSILTELGLDFTKKVVLDQPFSGNNPQNGMKYYEDSYAIIVDRDPRDNYLFTKVFLKRKGRAIPTDSVEKFVEYYRRLREGQPYREYNERILHIQFEDMVYDFDNTRKIIDAFCGLEHGKRINHFFEPSMSINNTQLFKRFPEYINDVDYIEKELSEYLYDFSKFEGISPNGKMFFGKSPLNK